MDKGEKGERGCPGHRRGVFSDNGTNRNTGELFTVSCQWCCLESATQQIIHRDSQGGAPEAKSALTECLVYRFHYQRFEIVS